MIEGKRTKHTIQRRSAEWTEKRRLLGAALAEHDKLPYDSITESAYPYLSVQDSDTYDAAAARGDATAMSLIERIQHSNMDSQRRSNY